MLYGLGYYRVCVEINLCSSAVYRNRKSSHFANTWYHPSCIAQPKHHAQTRQRKIVQFE